MPHILMVTNKRETLETLARALKAESSVSLDWATERSAALAVVAGSRPDLVVVDEYVGYLTNLEFIRQLVQVDAFVHTAAVSRLPRETFHEVAEGLGILAQLPPRPGVLEAERLLSLLETMTNAQT
jgi:DNA-binding response OmpR family regulator